MYYACQIIEGSWVLLNFASAVRITVPLVLDVQSRQMCFDLDWENLGTVYCGGTSQRRSASTIGWTSTDCKLRVSGGQRVGLPKYSQAEVTRAQSTIHCIRRFKSPSNCAKHCFMDPENFRSTRDEAYDISTMKENMASSSEESAWRRLLSTPEAGMWTKTFLTVMFFLQPRMRCNFLFGDCGQ